jgi:hypothetical protein
MKRCLLTTALALLLSVPAFADDAPVLTGVSAQLTKKELMQETKYADVLRITVTDQNDHPIKDAVVVATVQHGGVKLYDSQSTSGDPAAQASVTTDTQGIALVSLDTPSVAADKAPAIFVVGVAATVNGVTVENVVDGLVGSGFAETFFSDRVASEIFLGATFARSFDKDGKSQGFDENTPLGRFSVDTLWGFTEKTSSNWRLHTGLEAIFSAFPTARPVDTTTPAAPADDTKAGTETFVDFADSFSGRIYFLLQPKAWTSYTSTALRPEKPYDAFSWGLFAKVGGISRDTLTPSQDSLVLTGQVGVSFTHHQTTAPNQRFDKKNVFPLRFVEISYGYFEQFGKENDANRVIVDAGFRLARAGSTDFYSGIHLNGGPGEDDIRVFAGFLFHLDKVPGLFGH